MLLEVKGSVSNDQYVKMRAEAKSPFRLSRIFLFGSLLFGASAGLIIITGRLVQALKGGDGAPDLNESIQNFAVNLAAVGAFGFLTYRQGLSAGRPEAKFLYSRDKAGEESS